MSETINQQPSGRPFAEARGSAALLSKRDLEDMISALYGFEDMGHDGPRKKRCKELADSMSQLLREAFPPNEKGQRSGAGSLPRRVSRQAPWRCFHCDEVFWCSFAAADHFGYAECSTAACQVDAKALRKMERELASYRQEDTDLHRQIRSMECKHQTALMRAEESGYAKGLRDGRALSANAGTKRSGG